MKFCVSRSNTRTAGRTLSDSALGAVAIAVFTTAVSMLSPSYAEEADRFNIAYTGAFNATILRPEGSDISSECPLNVPINVYGNAVLGAATLQVFESGFKASSIVLNGTVVTLDLHTDRFHVEQTVPLTYSGAVAEARFNFTNDQVSMSCPARISLSPVNGASPVLSDQASSEPAGSSTKSVAASDDTMPEADGPSVWTGQAIPKDIIKNYGEFCDVRRPSKLTLEIDRSSVTGELVRALDGRIAKLNGKMRGNVLTGQLADRNGFNSKFILTARMEGNSITGTLAATAWNSCTATVTLSTDDPRYQVN